IAGDLLRLDNGDPVAVLTEVRARSNRTGIGTPSARHTHRLDGLCARRRWRRRRRSHAESGVRRFLTFAGACPIVEAQPWTYTLRITRTIPTACRPIRPPLPYAASTPWPGAVAPTSTRCFALTRWTERTGSNRPHRGCPVRPVFIRRRCGYARPSP